jgi:hypothetical protein
MYVSTVRSNHQKILGDVGDKQAINVMLTRGMKGLMIIGNAYTLNGGYQGNLWRRAIYYLSCKDAMFHFTPE